MGGWIGWWVGWVHGWLDWLVCRLGEWVAGLVGV